MSVLGVTFLLNASGENCFFTFSVSRGYLCSLACGPFLTSLQFLAFVITSRSTHSDLPASLLEGSPDYCGPTVSLSQDP